MTHIYSSHCIVSFLCIPYTYQFIIIISYRSIIIVVVIIVINCKSEIFNTLSPVAVYILILYLQLVILGL